MAAARDPVAADQDGPLQGDQPDHGARAGEAPAGGREHQLPTEALTRADPAQMGQLSAGAGKLSK